MSKYTLFALSQADSRPLYVQIIERIRERVAVRDWLPGNEIPSIRQLASDLKVSVITVKRAYLELERDGVNLTRQGKGSFIAPNVDLGTKLQQQELHNHLTEAARIAALLGLSQSDLLSKLRETHQRAKKETS